MVQPDNIIITGASSGIGAALARHYSAPGVTLGLLGRNETRLNEVAAECTRRGAAVKTGSINVTDASRLRDWLLQFDDAHPVTLLIANAGVSAGAGGKYESPEQVRNIFAVNVDGVVASVMPLLPRMITRKTGQIALMSSLAGLRGLPSCPAYSASKSAVRAFGEGLRGLYKETNIRVNVICPGYIHTPMTDVNDFPMPFIMSAERAARIIARGLSSNRARIAFPLPLYLPLWLLTCLPAGLTDPFFAALPRKSAIDAASS